MGEPALPALAAVPTAPIDPDLWLRFAERARELLASDDEPLRRRLEDEVLQLAAALAPTGVFATLQPTDPALAAMVADHLAEQVPAPRACRTLLRVV